jgi:hypothetical protein
VRGTQPLVCMAAVSVGAWHAELMRTELPDVTAAYVDFEKLTEVRSRASIVAEILKSAMSRVANSSMFVVIACTLTTTRDTLQVAAKAYLPLVLIYVAPLSSHHDPRSELVGSERLYVLHDSRLQSHPQSFNTLTHFGGCM